MNFGKFISDKKRLGYWPNKNHPLYCYRGEIDWEDMFDWVDDYVDETLNQMHNNKLID